MSIINLLTKTQIVKLYLTSEKIRHHSLYEPSYERKGKQGPLLFCYVHFVLSFVQKMSMIELLDLAKKKQYLSDIMHNHSFLTGCIIHYISRTFVKIKASIFQTIYLLSCPPLLIRLSINKQNIFHDTNHLPPFLHLSVKVPDIMSLLDERKWMISVLKPIVVFTSFISASSEFHVFSKPAGVAMGWHRMAKSIPGQKDSSFLPPLEIFLRFFYYCLISLAKERFWNKRFWGCLPMTPFYIEISNIENMRISVANWMK